ncbi:hypothetical protein SAMN05216353_13435 [Halobacillus alkaliphilus]|uniref:Uncharacterized protein n=1 Tax=Halobacillus alkaliphilus TaxID=396056 RepID=A0A1I2QUY7_9BACI|nr:hypothetical protein [Halobacillus alkaliphilus]SFG32108.1 hypothetical protein SAMN05216353_13435 [Halobacillus alkaliphilus]
MQPVNQYNMDLFRFYQALKSQITDELIKDTTQFENFEEFITFLPLSNESLPKDEPTEELDQFISDTTDYSCWLDFLNTCC